MIINKIFLINIILLNETKLFLYRLKKKMVSNMKRITLSIIFLLVTLTSCRFTGIRGDGDLQTLTREIDNFDKVDVSGNFEVEIEVGQPRNLVIIAENNLQDFIKTYVKRNTLFISTKKNLKPTEELRIQISIPYLNGIECSGVNDVFAKGIDADNFYIDLSGAGSIDIKGNARTLKIDVSGAADLRAKELLTENIKIDVSGAANASVYASKSCIADVSGAGFIELYGEAQDVNMDISGAGSLKRK